MSLFTQLPKISAFTESDRQKADKWQKYSDSDQIPTEQSDRSVSKVQSILTLIGNLWQNAIASLTKEPEIHERQEKDRSDWHEYDPWTSECFLRDRFFRDQLNDLDR
ncbi:hypothetical protein [Pseudanabaena sp. PCC 6802]|uniref:hypothetical protein n=1 Tax=Pseudanabaena sp. PCC 6802 TaxID=118173 RepID=UPI000344A343|nr:hypothetical protein [Pseudanabaena sp. PCC 6802]